jgi:GTP-binding protein HflX
LKTLHYTTTDTTERALLVGLERPDQDRWTMSESLEELGELVKSAGAEVTDTAVQRLDAPTAAFFIGKGKAEELSRLCGQKNVSSVVFDEELSPAQSRNLERVFNRKIIDRTQLILDIFAQRAKTKEGKLQIELAQLQYLLPRLTRMWTHLSRQNGGIGTRGPGETQLEVDRRRVQEKIARLERELSEVRQNRQTQRQGRLRAHWPICSLVGYTNAGKSTLFNALTSSDVYAANKLFATLDPTTRQFVLPNRQKMLITDTVGFLKKLPTHLVESFKSTLEEVAEADVLMHVVDLSHPLYEAQMLAVQKVLEELKAWGKQMIIVFNKVDKVTSASLVQHCLDKYPASVAVSGKTGQGMDQLEQEIEHQVRSWRLQVTLQLPNHETALISEMHRFGRVLDLVYVGDQVKIVAHIPPQLQGKLKPYIVGLDESPAGDTSRGPAPGTPAGGGSEFA